MADKLDQLLLDIGREADGKVDYAALKAAVLTENAKRIKRQGSYARYIGMAAAFIALLGVGSVVLFGNGAKGEAPMLAAAPSAMAPAEAECESAAATEETAAEEAPACAEKPVEGAASGSAAARSEEQLLDNSASADSGLYSASSAFSPDDKFFIGVPAEGWQDKLAADGSVETSPVDPVADLEEGWAYLGPMGGFALWQTPDGTYELFTQTDSREALSALLQSVCE